jgi:hypothetical protein
MRAMGALSRVTGAGALACLLAAATGVAAQPAGPGAEDAEDLVRGVWFEGLPLDRAARLGPGDGARLAEMLADPDEAPHHANIALALGACGCGPAFEALAEFDAGIAADDDPQARAARLAVPHAMGLLASRDPRALDWLIAQTEEPAPSGEDRPGRQRRTMVLDGLALAGSPRADARLAALEEAAAEQGDAAIQRRAALARARAARGATR